MVKFFYFCKSIRFLLKYLYTVCGFLNWFYFTNRFILQALLPIKMNKGEKTLLGHEGDNDTELGDKKKSLGSADLENYKLSC